MSGFVYFVAPEALFHRDEYDALVKIGFTRGNPHARLAALQTGSPVHLKLWAYADGSPELEKAFHNTFAGLRSHGEWFWAHFKFRDFLGYLGHEPNTGNRITKEQLEVAVFDNIFSSHPPYPDTPESEWLASAEPQYLRPFFPHLWEEVYG